jgi:hypothetical protein
MQKRTLFIDIKDYLVTDNNELLRLYDKIAVFHEISKNKGEEERNSEYDILYSKNSELIEENPEIVIEDFDVYNKSPYFRDYPNLGFLLNVMILLETNFESIDFKGDSDYMQNIKKLFPKIYLN